jgi:DNA-binding MarR family transcriptional regulator
MIAIVEKTARVMREDMITDARARGYEWAQQAHNAVFSTLPAEGARAADMAERAGITRQSMGEVIRDLAERGIVEMVPDPTDGRAKIVRYTEAGIIAAQGGFNHILELDQLFRKTFGDEDYETARRVLAGVMALLGNDQLVGQV